jgi:NADPH-ferrihemoprotein reductase
VLYVVSSTGDGDPPDNCAAFYAGLKRQSNRQNLLKAKNVRFTVLGLGDQNYTAFMQIPRDFWKQMEFLGATPFYPRGEADEVEGLDEYVDQWTSNLWAPLTATLQGLDPQGGELHTVDDADIEQQQQQQQQQQQALKGVPALPPCRLHVTLGAAAASAASAVSALPEPAVDGGVDGKFSHAAPLMAKVGAWRLLTAESSDRRVLHMEVELGDSGVTYAPGDSLAVLPANLPESVDAVLVRAGRCALC